MKNGNICHPHFILGSWYNQWKVVRAPCAHSPSRSSSTESTKNLTVHIQRIIAVETKQRRMLPNMIPQQPKYSLKMLGKYLNPRLPRRLQLFRSSDPKLNYLPNQWKSVTQVSTENLKHSNENRQNLQLFLNRNKHPLLTRIGHRSV